MIGLARAEWLRLRRRGDIWIVLLLVVGLSVIGYISGLSSAGSIQYGFPPGEEIPPEMLEEMERMRREALATFAFPLSISTSLEGGRILLLFVGAYLAAAITGAEFEYGTIRTSLVARGDRGGFVLVRLMAVLALVAVLLIVTVLLSIVMPLVASALGTDFPPVVGPGPLSVAGMMGATLLTAAFVIGLTTFVAILLRNAVIALVIMLATTFADSAIGGLLVRFLGEDTPLKWLTPLANAQLLYDRASGDVVAREIPNLLAVAVGFGWAALVWAGAMFALRRADVRD